MKSEQAIAYRVQAVRPLAPGDLATAALMQCMVTGATLSGMGGGGEFISPQVREWLRSPEARLAYRAYASGGTAG